MKLAECGTIGYRLSLDSLRLVDGLEVFRMEDSIQCFSLCPTHSNGLCTALCGALWTPVLSLSFVENEVPFLARTQLRGIVPHDIMTAGKANDDGVLRVAAF